MIMNLLKSNTLSNRRSFVMSVAGLGVAAIASTSLGAHAAGGPLVARFDLNGRAGATVTSKILAVILRDEMVTDLDPMSPEIVNGYRHIRTLAGVTCWAIDEGLKRQGADDPDPEFPEYRLLAHDDYLLDEPQTSSFGLYLPIGTTIKISYESQNGYQFVQYSDGIQTVNGWVQVAYICPAGATRLTVYNDAPQLETTPMFPVPNEEAAEVAQVPNGAVVIDYDNVIVDDFRGVDWNGTVGWIQQRHLGVG